jgi:hypothetical protein
VLNQIIVHVQVLDQEIMFTDLNEKMVNMI